MIGESGYIECNKKAKLGLGSRNRFTWCNLQGVPSPWTSAGILSEGALADSELQKRGAIFSDQFLMTFLGITPQKFPFPKQMFVYHPNFLMTFFSHRPFNTSNVAFLRRGIKSSSQRLYGGPKTLNFAKFTLLSLFFLSPRGGQTPLPTSKGVMTGLAPESATERGKVF